MKNEILKCAGPLSHPKIWAPIEQREGDSVKSLCENKNSVWSQNEE